MKKDSRINFRVNSNLLKIFKEFCSKNDVTLSGIFDVMIRKIVFGKDIPKDLDKEIKILIVKEKRKELCNRIYISKNMYRRVTDIALSSYLISGSVNMKAINAVVDSFIEEFDSYDSSLKDKIGVDFKLTAKRLRNRDFLVGQSKSMKTLAYLKSK